jgi:hypothetical protein
MLIADLIGGTAQNDDPEALTLLQLPRAKLGLFAP